VTNRHGEPIQVYQMLYLSHMKFGLAGTYKILEAGSWEDTRALQVSERFSVNGPDRFYSYIPVISLQVLFECMEIYL